MTAAIEEELLEDLYTWVDQIPLTRPKKDIRRDFADGVLVAEVVKHFIPHLVEMHNYPAANNTKNKTTNWKLFNKKVLFKLNIDLKDEVIDNIVACKPFAIEHFLMMLRRKVDRYLFEAQRLENERATRVAMNEQPESDQVHVDAHATPQKPGKKHEKTPKAKGSDLTNTNPSHHNFQSRGDWVPRILVEEKAQEILAKDETIQILNAKVRRLEHLLHLKDIRVDDLQQRIDRLDSQLRPTAHKSSSQAQKSSPQAQKSGQNPHKSHSQGHKISTKQ